MPQFFVDHRPVNAYSDDIEEKRRQMEKRGFSQKKPGSDTNGYQLPPFQFFIEGDFTEVEVKHKAEEAAAATGKLWEMPRITNISGGVQSGSPILTLSK